VKYMILLHGSQQDYDAMAGRPGGKPPMSAEQVAAMHAHMGAVHEKLVASGELVDAQGLVAPAHTRRVQLEGGVPVVTDGPYPETRCLPATPWSTARASTGRSRSPPSS
jgi:hypothetical protein